MASDLKIFSIMLVAAAAIILLAGCTSPLQSPTGASKPVVMAFDQWPPAWYFDVAINNGYLARENVSVDIIRFNGSYSELLETFAENRSIDCMDVTTIDLLNLREKGVWVKAIFPIDQSTGSDVIVANPNITSVSQLRGKRVGYEEFNSFGHLFTVKLLEKYNLSESDVRMQILPMGEIPRAIEAGRLDAGHTFEPVTFEAIAKGQREIGSSSELPPLIFDVIACRKQVIDERPADVQGLVNAWFAAKAFEKENPANAHSIMANANGMPIAELETYFSGNRLYGFEDGTEAVSSTNQSGVLSTINIARNFLLERGQASGNVQSEELIDRRFMQNARWQP